MKNDIYVSATVFVLQFYHLTSGTSYVHLVLTMFSPLGSWLLCVVFGINLSILKIFDTKDGCLESGLSLILHLINQQTLTKYP